MKRIRFNFKRRWKIIVLCVGILALVGFWLARKQGSTEAQLVFIKPEKGNLVKTIEVNGAINAKEYARLRFAAGGKITYLGAKEGDVVSRGQTIAMIDPSSLQKNLERSLNLYDRERLDWEQTQDNTQDRWLPKNEERSVQQNNIDLKNTVIDVELNTIAIQNSRLTSPLAGVLVSSPTHIAGVTLGPTDTFEVINPGSLIFQALVDESDISVIKQGQSAKILLDAYPDQEVLSSVNYISYKSAQSSTGTVFIVEFPIVQPDLNRFRIGMNGDVNITIDTRDNALSIPLDATIERDGKVYVQVRTGENTAEEREIEVGMETDDRIEVLSGLSDQDEIVLPQ